MSTATWHLVQATALLMVLLLLVRNEFFAFCLCFVIFTLLFIFCFIFRSTINTIVYAWFRLLLLGNDNQTECKACTLACHNLKLFNDNNNKTTCKSKYYNYGTQQQIHCDHNSTVETNSTFNILIIYVNYFLMLFYSLYIWFLISLLIILIIWFYNAFFL